MEDTLPPGQGRVLSIFAEAELSGRNPSRAEIAAQLHYAFPSAVSKHVEALARKGYLIVDLDKKRNVRLTELGWKASGYGDRPALAPAMTLPRAGVPILGAIAAGTPIEAIEQTDGFLRDLAPLPGRFALRVRGDSMINAGIHDGDYAVIQQGAPVAQDGIGAVVVGTDATLKRVHRRDDGLELVAENPLYRARFIPNDELHEVHIVGPLLFIYRAMP